MEQGGTPPNLREYVKEVEKRKSENQKLEYRANLDHTLHLNEFGLRQYWFRYEMDNYNRAEGQPTTVFKHRFMPPEQYQNTLKVARENDETFESYLAKIGIRSVTLLHDPTLVKNPDDLLIKRK